MKSKREVISSKMTVEQWKELVEKFGEEKVAADLGITVKKLRRKYEETFSESLARQWREKRIKC